jgi:hypothetical protein
MRNSEFSAEKLEKSKLSLADFMPKHKMMIDQTNN